MEAWHVVKPVCKLQMQNFFGKIDKELQNFLGKTNKVFYRRSNQAHN